MNQINYLKLLYKGNTDLLAKENIITETKRKRAMPTGPSVLNKGQTVLASVLTYIQRMCTYKNTLFISHANKDVTTN